mmetsp:Transcript_14477/g.34033  ORF Transcript_14477/g.34033 Transcript_14477/m.34033 type:complete len:247 (-) Transcript_14477:556-1296(-)
MCTGALHSSNWRLRGHSLGLFPHLLGLAPSLTSTIRAVPSPVRHRTQRWVETIDVPAIPTVMAQPHFPVPFLRTTFAAPDPFARVDFGPVHPFVQLSFVFRVRAGCLAVAPVEYSNTARLTQTVVMIDASTFFDVAPHKSTLVFAVRACHGLGVVGRLICFVQEVFGHSFFLIQERRPQETILVDEGFHLAGQWYFFLPSTLRGFATERTRLRDASLAFWFGLSLLCRTILRLGGLQHPGERVILG